MISKLKQASISRVSGGIVFSIGVEGNRTALSKEAVSLALEKIKVGEGDAGYIVVDEDKGLVHKYFKREYQPNVYLARTLTNEERNSKALIKEYDQAMDDGSSNERRYRKPWLDFDACW